MASHGLADWAEIWGLRVMARMKYEAAIAGQRAYIVNLESQAAPSAVVA